MAAKAEFRIKFRVSVRERVRLRVTAIMAMRLGLKSLNWTNTLAYFSVTPLLTLKPLNPLVRKLFVKKSFFFVTDTRDK